MGKHIQKKEKPQRHLKAPETRKPRRTAEDNITAREHPDFGLTKKNIAETAGSLVLFIIACALKLDGWMNLAAFALVFLTAFYTVLLRTIEEVFSKNYFDECYPVIIASVITFAIGDYSAGAAVMIFYRLAKLIEATTVRMSKKMHTDMQKELPESVNVLMENGSTAPMPVFEVAIGDIIEVAPNEMIALDGIVVDGMSAVDISTLTDSSENYTVTRGNHVFSGTINTDDDIKVKVTRVHADSTAQRLCYMLENVQRYRAEHEKYVDKLVKWFSPAVTVLAIVIAVVPSILTGEWKVWMGRVALLLALSNTAVLPATSSMCFVGAIAALAKCGVVVKGTRFIEALARTKTMVFNKTGTITDGRYIVTDVVPTGMNDYELLITAARAEQFSFHPIARAICAACGTFERDMRDDVKCESITGRGISTFVRGKHIYVGNAALLEEKGVHCDVPRRNGAAIHVALDGKYCGYLILNERVREGVFDTMEELRVLGVRNTVLLTDDVRSIARQVASSLSFDMVKPEQTPESKVAAVEYLLATKPDRSTLAVVSDKASDTESLERADIGISVASLGAEAALESADVLIMANELHRLPIAMRTAKLAYTVALQNVALFMSVKILLMMLGVFGAISVFPAVVIDLAASALTLANAYRTVYKK